MYLCLQHVHEPRKGKVDYQQLSAAKLLVCKVASMYK